MTDTVAGVEKRLLLEYGQEVNCQVCVWEFLQVELLTILRRKHVFLALDNSLKR